VNEAAETGAIAVGVAAFMKLLEKGKKVRSRLRKKPINIYERNFISNTKCKIRNFEEKFRSGVGDSETPVRIN
jgi:hypothetical protein